MEKSTPGPWNLRIHPGMGPDGEPYFYIEALPGARAGMEFPQATCVVDPELGILTEEDARLIAATPDLLSIAKRWAALDAGAWLPNRHAAEKAQLLEDTATAIAKATTP